MTDTIALKVEVRNTRMIDAEDTARAERIINGINALVRERDVLSAGVKYVQWKHDRLFGVADRLRKRLEEAHKSRGEAQRVIGKLHMRLASIDDPQYDGTPLESAAYSRGRYRMLGDIIGKLTNVLDGKDDGAGVFSNEVLNRFRDRLLALRKKRDELKDAARIWEERTHRANRDADREMRECIAAKAEVARLRALVEVAFREGATLYEDYDPGMTQDEAWNGSDAKRAMDAPP